jgi:hypothetical protein
MKRKFSYRCLWQAKLLSRKTSRKAIPIEISSFRRVKGTIGLHGYRRVRKEDREGVRAYRKDSYGVALIYIDIEQRSIEAKTEAWGGLMGVCSDLNLTPYRTF